MPTQSHSGLKTRTDWFLPLKIWLLCIVLVAPLLWALLSYYIHAPVFTNWRDLQILPLIIGFGLFFSLPTLLVTYLAYAVMIKRKLPFMYTFIGMLLVAIIGGIVTFLSIDIGLSDDLIWIYSVSILLSASIFSKRLIKNIKPPERLKNQLNSRP